MQRVSQAFAGPEQTTTSGWTMPIGPFGISVLGRALNVQLRSAGLRTLCGLIGVSPLPSKRASRSWFIFLEPNLEPGCRQRGVGAPPVRHAHSWACHVVATFCLGPSGGAAFNTHSAAGPDGWTGDEVHDWPVRAWTLFLDVWQRWAISVFNRVIASAVAKRPQVRRWLQALVNDDVHGAIQDGFNTEGTFRKDQSRLPCLRRKGTPSFDDRNVIASNAPQAARVWNFWQGWMLRLG